MAKIHEVGSLGEDISSRYLICHGFRILERNYKKFLGEIDIIAKKSGILYFVEVKARERRGVPRETDSFRPEDHVHQKKLERLSRTVQVYLDERGYDGEWKFLVIAVDIDKTEKKAKIRIIEDVL